MHTARFDHLTRALAAGRSRRQVLRAIGGAAAGVACPGACRRHALAQTETPTAENRPLLDPIFVSPDPFSLGGNEFLLDGKIFPLAPEAATLLTGEPSAPVAIDGDIYFIDPAVATLAQDVSGTPVAEFPIGPEETPCGLDDSQDVGTYLGNLGVTREFVDTHQRPVGNIRWNGNLPTIFADPGTVNAKRWCSGTMITENLFLTAGHCLSQTPFGWRVPSIDGTGDPIPREEIARHMHVDFNYQIGPDGLDQVFTSFPVAELVEIEREGLDYAILRLEGNPGLTFGLTPLASSNAPLGETICIIGHPEGLPKRIEAGPASQYDGPFIFYNDIDTAGGSSGSGILASPGGPIVGIHTTGGCTSDRTGHNFGVAIAALLEASPVLRQVASQAGPTPAA